VRSCARAAYALSEIIKSNEKIRGKLVPDIEEIVKNKENNGVRNVYIKALRTIGVKV
jgi:hypothetical protein